MIASTITARNIIRSVISDKLFHIDKHTYTDKTSIKDANRRSVCFKSFSPILYKNELIEKINSEFAKYGYTNKVTITRKGYSPYEYIRVIAYI